MEFMTISASELLKTMCSAFQEAGSVYDIKTPTAISRQFRDLLITSYSDVAGSYELDTEVLGRFLGNSSRWNLPLCRYITLRFLSEITRAMESTGLGVSVQPSEFLKPFTNPTANLKVRLNYSLAEIGSGVISDPAVLFLGDARTIAVKARVRYPNVSVMNTFGTDNYGDMWKWVNLRYQRNSDGSVAFVSLPKFEASKKPEFEGRSLFSTKGLITSMDGRLCKFSYCQLASQVRNLCVLSLSMLNGEPVNDTETAKSRFLFDLLNLVQKTNVRFSLEGQSIGTSIGTSTASPLRINPAQKETVFVIFGGFQEMEDLSNRPDLISTAYKASDIDIGLLDLYEDLEDDGGLFALVFQTQTVPDFESDDSVTWDSGIELQDFDILNEEDMFEVIDS